MKMNKKLIASLIAFIFCIANTNATYALRSVATAVSAEGVDFTSSAQENRTLPSANQEIPDFALRELDYIRKVYAREEVFKIRDGRDFLEILKAIKKIPTIDSDIKGKIEYYFPGDVPDENKIKKLYNRCVRLYKNREGTGKTFTLYSLLVIRDVMSYEKTREPFGKDSDISWQEFFALLDIYLDINLDFVLGNLSQDISFLNRFAAKEIFSFKPVKKTRSLEEEIALGGNKLTLRALKKELKEHQFISKEFVGQVEKALRKAGYRYRERKRYLHLILVLASKIGGFRTDFATAPQRICPIIETLKGERLEEAFDLYNTLALAGNSNPYILDALAFAYRRLVEDAHDEDTYDKALRESYRLARLGINPSYFLKNFIPYAGIKFKGEAFDKMIASYEDTALTFYKVLGERPQNPPPFSSNPETKMTILAIKRDVEGKHIYKKEGKEHEYISLADYVSEEDLLYSLELAQELAALFNYSETGLLPVLTEVAANVGRKRYRETVEWLCDLLISDKNPFCSRYDISNFILKVISGIASKLSPDNFKGNILRVLNLVDKMKEKKLNSYFVVSSFDAWNVKVYINDQEFPIFSQ